MIELFSLFGMLKPVAVTEKQKRENQKKLEAISNTQAIIEFDIGGTILNANENFLKTVGYSLDEIEGKHHSIFVEEKDRGSEGYERFWRDLRDGKTFSNEYKRIGKGGREIWILASYNPLFDEMGKPYKIIKFAMDITKDKLRNSDLSGQISAIGRSQAVIEFDMNGIILDANKNFLTAVGYELNEIVGQHHSMFVEESDRTGMEYQQFWSNLRAGQYFVNEYKRIGKGGRKIWIQASYNPIFDMNGQPFKVVKYATDITDKVNAKREAGDMMGSSATATEQLNASIHEIAKNMSYAKDRAENTSMRTVGADESSIKLTEASANMTGIVALISDIADQINLLALNATIEAARAGEAGKGFAVVANEVKSLAGQTKDATEKIAHEINAMQDVSQNVVEDLKLIRESIQEVSDYVISTTASVEEQSMVAQELAATMQNVSGFINNL